MAELSVLSPQGKTKKEKEARRGRRWQSLFQDSECLYLTAGSVGDAEEEEEDRVEARFISSPIAHHKELGGGDVSSRRPPEDHSGGANEPRRPRTE